MRRWMTGVLAVLVFGFPALRAQELLVPLSDVVGRVVERDPGVRAREAEKDAARAEARRTETLRLPKLYVSTDMGGGKLVNDVANVLLTGLNPASVTDPKTRSRLQDLSSDRPFVVPGARLEDNLFDGGRTAASIRSARLSESKAGVARDRVREDKAYATASDFLSLARAQVLGRYLEDYVKVTDLAAKALSDQAQAGRITAARALAGEAKLRAAQAGLENNRDDVRLVSDLLRDRGGYPAQAVFDTRALESRLESSTLAILPEEYRVENHPLLQDAVLDAQIREQQVRAAKASRLPELKFVAEYGFSFSSLLFTFRPGYNIAVRASYPLFTSGEVQRNVEAERRRFEAARFAEEDTRASLHEEYARLLGEHRKLGRELDAARSQIAQAEELYRVERLKYDQGAGSPSDLLEAAELLLNSRQRSLELTRSSLLLRWAALRFQGELLAELQRAALP